MESKLDRHCAYCGKPAHRRVEKIYNPHNSGTEASRARLNGTRETWDYTGDGVVIRRDRAKPYTWGSNAAAFLHSVTVWDGKTWELTYDPFCKLMCAYRFARAAHAAGYRRLKLSECVK